MEWNSSIIHFFSRSLYLFVSFVFLLLLFYFRLRWKSRLSCQYNTHTLFAVLYSVRTFLHQVLQYVICWKTISSQFNGRGEGGVRWLALCLNKLVLSTTIVLYTLPWFSKWWNSSFWLMCFSSGLLLFFCCVICLIVVIKWPISSICSIFACNARFSLPISS